MPCVVVPCTCLPPRGTKRKGGAGLRRVRPSGGCAWHHALAADQAGAAGCAAFRGAQPVPDSASAAIQAAGTHRAAPAACRLPRPAASLRAAACAHPLRARSGADRARNRHRARRADPAGVSARAGVRRGAVGGAWRCWASCGWCRCAHGFAQPRGAPRWAALRANRSRRSPKSALRLSRAAIPQPFEWAAKQLSSSDE